MSVDDFFVECFEALFDLEGGSTSVCAEIAESNVSIVEKV
jgi:hypothetical protein